MATSQSLEQIFLLMKQQTNALTINPLLNCFDQDALIKIEQDSGTDDFIAGKRKKILTLVAAIKGPKIDFDPLLKSAYDEYSEALAYLRLKSKFAFVERIVESSDKSPDFKIKFTSGRTDPQDFEVFAELKSMAFSDGNLNYKKTMEAGFAAQIDIEDQFKKGRTVAFGITEIQPLLRENKEYRPDSVKYAIETLIEKIEQNLKEGQFTLGDTVLLIDLKQLTLPSHFMEGALPVFQEQQYNSFMSGVQWHVAFGKVGHLIFKQIEFEGKENVEGELGRNGILVGRDWIKAVIFFDYALASKEPEIIGLFRRDNASSGILAFLHQFCHFVNDDKNSYGFMLHEKK